MTSTLRRPSQKLFADLGLEQGYMANLIAKANNLGVRSEVDDLLVKLSDLSKLHDDYIESYRKNSLKSMLNSVHNIRATLDELEKGKAA